MVKVIVAENEEAVTLHGYAAAQPMVSLSAGKSDPVNYDTSTGHFNVKVIPTGSTDHSAADPVRYLTITVKTAK